MTNVLDTFLELQYHPEMTQLLRDGFAVLDAYEFPEYAAKYLDVILSADQQDPANVTDRVVDMLQADLDNILGQHGMILRDDTPLLLRVQLTLCLNQLENLHDYNDVLPRFEAAAPPEEIFADLVAEYSLIEEMTLLNALERFDADILEKLKVLALSHPFTVGDDPLPQPGTAELLQKFKQFQAFLENRETLGNAMIANGGRIGHLFLRYLPLVREFLQERSPEELATDVLSVLLLSSDGSREPQTVFSRYGEQLFSSLDELRAVSTALAEVVGRFNLYGRK